MTDNLSHHARPSKDEIREDLAKIFELIGKVGQETFHAVTAEMKASLHESREEWTQAKDALGRLTRRDRDAEVLTLEEAATLLKVTPQQLEAAAVNGEVPGRKLGDQWRFHRGALLAWCEGHE